MAYNTASPPTQRHQDIGNKGAAHWGMSGTDAFATVAVAGYISNAKDLGMKVGDTVQYRQDVSPPVITNAFVAAISAAGAADLTDGTAISSTNTN